MHINAGMLKLWRMTKCDVFETPSSIMIVLLIYTQISSVAL